jgi:hypothetical protein
VTTARHPGVGAGSNGRDVREAPGTIARSAVSPDRRPSIPARHRRGQALTSVLPPFTRVRGSTPALERRDSMTSAAQPLPTGRRDRTLGAVGQVAGTVGILVCIVLVVGVVVGRSWLLGRVDSIQGRVDAGLVRAETLIDNTSARISEVSGRVGAVTDAATAIASSPNPAPALTEALLAQLSGVSDRYLALRASYADVRETAVGVLDRLNTLDALLPFFSVPQGPVDALSSLDARLQELDAAMMQVLTTPGAGAVNAVAGAVAEKTTAIITALTNLNAKLADGKVRLESLRGDVAATADQVGWYVTLVSFLLLVLLVYIAFLHWLLFRVGRTRWREAAVSNEGSHSVGAATPATPDAAIPDAEAPDAVAPDEATGPGAGHPDH